MKITVAAPVIAVLVLFPLLTTPSVVGKDGGGPKPHLVFSCQPNNDLYVAWRQSSGIPALRYPSAAEAVGAAPPGAGVLILADGYPDRTTLLEAELFKTAATKRLRLYLEFPSFLPGIKTGPVREIIWERAVVSSAAFGPSLQKMRILEIHRCRFIPVNAENAHLVMARVAGYDSARSRSEIRFLKFAFLLSAVL